MPLLVLVAAAVLVNHRAECTAVVFKMQLELGEWQDGVRECSRCARARLTKFSSRDSLLEALVSRSMLRSAGLWHSTTQQYYHSNGRSVYKRQSTKNVVHPYSTRLLSVPKAKGSANIGTVDGAFILLVELSSGGNAAFQRKCPVHKFMSA